ncbi:hypothetical protein D9M72_450890 [compost metagenome]
MDHDVRPVLDRPHQVRRAQGGVDDQRNAGVARHLCQPLKVLDFRRRVGHHLDEDRLGVLPDRGGVVRRVGAGDECGVHPEAAQRDVELGDRAAVQLGGRHDVVACLGERGKGDELRGHARRRRNGSDAALQGGNALFERCHRGVADPGVDVAVLLQGEEVGGVLGVLEDEGRGLVDRDGPRAVLGVGCAAGVQGAGAEAELAVRHYAFTSPVVFDASAATGVPDRSSSVPFLRARSASSSRTIGRMSWPNAATSSWKCR